MMQISKTTHVYKTADGCEIRADVHRAEQTPEAAPVIVWIHGGALIVGSRAHIQPEQLERYLAAGYVVVCIDYRLAPETKLPAIIEDVQDACWWVREEGPELFDIDPDRMAIIGHSAGGYLTLMAGTFRPRPRALVSFYGYGDIVGDWYSKPDPFYCRQPRVTKEAAYESIGTVPISEPARDRGQFYLYCRQQGTWPDEVSGWNLQTEPEAFVPYCPVRNVSPDYPPTLLLHGKKDTDVPFEQMSLMVDELAEADVDHELVTIYDGGHCFDMNAKSPEVREAFDYVMSFLNRYTAEE